MMEARGQVDNTRARQHHGAKPANRLATEAVIEIRTGYAAGLCQRYLAAVYGTTRPAISNIVNARTWKQVGPPVRRDREPSSSQVVQQIASLDAERCT